MERHVPVTTIYDSKVGPGWVLLVEDDTIIAEGLGEGLKRHGYRPVYSTTVGEAMSKLANQQFSMILLDIRLVRGSGEQIIHFLKSHAGPNHDTPIMVMSAFVDIDLLHRVRAFVDGVLVKPFNLLTLVNRVNGILKERQDSPDRNSKLHKSSPHAPIAGKPALEEFWGTNPETELKEMIGEKADAQPDSQDGGENEIKFRFYSNVEKAIHEGEEADELVDKGDGENEDAA